MDTMKESKLILMTNPNVSNPPVAHADSYRQDKMQPLTSRERSARRALRWPRRLFEQPRAQLLTAGANEQKFGAK
jgi:hypothetical protein